MRQVFATLLLLASVAVATPNRLGGQSPVERYVVGIDTALSALTVEAALHIRSGALFMHTRGTGDRNYWRRQVRDLRVVDSLGVPLGVDSIGEGRFAVARGYTGAATLHYKVDLGFTRAPFESGNQKTGWRVGQAVYLVTKPVFIVSDTADRLTREVRFSLPASLSVAAPWQQRAGTPESYLVSGIQELNHNSLVIGRFTMRTIQHDAFTMRIAFLGDLGTASAPIGRVLDNVLRYYVTTFGVPNRTNYLMSFYVGDADAGEAYASSSVTSMRVPPSAVGLPMWGNTIAHELFHLWNSSWLRSASRDSTEWFSEGFTEYFANRAMRQGGLISREAFLAKMTKHFGAYAFWQDRPMFGASMVEAGRDKTLHTLGLYDGGWSLAFVLDMTLRAKQPPATLESYMRALFHDHAAAGRPYGYGDLVRGAEALLGPRGGDLFERHVAGRALLPLDEATRLLGLDLQLAPGAAEAILAPLPDASRIQRQRLARFLDGY